MPSVPIDQHNRALILYRKGDFRGALNAYTAILEKWLDKTNPPLSILDGRAATFLKLNKYDEALKDARSMIKADKTAPSGYLRAGHILRKQELFKKAASIYELGIESMEDSAAKSLLQKEMNEVNKQIIPDGAKDWLMTALPHELLLMIIEKLEFRELVPLTRVCKTWRNLLIGTPRLWQNLDVDSKRLIKHKTLESYTERAQRKVTKIRMKLPPPGTARMLLKQNRYLESIDWLDTTSQRTALDYLPLLMDTKNLRRLSIFVHGVTLPVAFQLLEAVPRLQELSLRLTTRSDIVDVVKDDCKIPPTLRSLTLSSLRGSIEIVPALDTATGLEQLTIHQMYDQHVDLRHLKQLRNLDLRLTSRSGSPVSLPSGIETVRLVFNDSSFSMAHGLDAVLDKPTLPHIRSLHVSGSPRLQELLPQCGSSLRSLELGGGWNDCSWAALLRCARLGRFPELAMLRCIDLRLATDDDLAFIGKSFLGLQEFWLANDQMITGSGIRQLVEATRGLKRLGLCNCVSVNADVVSWARNRGIKVSVQHPFS